MPTTSGIHSVGTYQGRGHGPDFPTEARTGCDCGPARLRCLPSISLANRRHLCCTQPFLSTASMIQRVASSIWIDRPDGWQTRSGASEETVPCSNYFQPWVIDSSRAPICASICWPNTLLIETKASQCPDIRGSAHIEVTWTAMHMLPRTGPHTISTNYGSQAREALRPRPMPSLPCIFTLPSYLNSSPSGSLARG